MNESYDVIVVGAGPGGSTAARFCAKAGLNVLLIEKERFPRYKACAGCLSLRTVQLLGFDLSPVIENTIYGAKFTYCLRNSFIINSKEPIAHMVMRNRFDQLLAQKASEQGVHLIEGEKVVKVEDKGHGVELMLAGGEKLFCEYLIGADGPGSIVAHSISLSSPKNNGGGIGLECEVPFESAVNFSKEDLHLMHLDFGRIPNGYGWVFPKREGLSIGIGGMFREGKKVNPHRYFTEFVKGLNYIDQEKMGRLVGHQLPPFYDEGQKVSRGRVLLVGDAAHLMDPLTGEGIYYALQSGMLAAEAIIQSKMNGAYPSTVYQRAVSNLMFEDLKWALNISRFIYRFTKLAYRTLEHYPELGNLYLLVMEGKETYQGFVTGVKKRVQDLLKGRFSDKIRKAMARN